jgi:peptidyl-tRNA hydrolase, PTH1 family
VRGAPSGTQVVAVGLGNPGPSYARHRHNIGFMAVDEIAEERRGQWRAIRDKTLICSVEIEAKEVILAKPQTFMNLSGKAVISVLKAFNGNPAHMIVIHDDLDLPLGSVRIKVGGGDGGHKGVRSVADSLRFRDFARVRLGVGRPPEGVSAEAFVLAPFDPGEDAARLELIKAAGLALNLILAYGVEQARNMVGRVCKGLKIEPSGE